MYFILETLKMEPNISYNIIIIFNNNPCQRVSNENNATDQITFIISFSGMNINKNIMILEFIVFDRYMKRKQKFA